MTANQSKAVAPVKMEVNGSSTSPWTPLSWRTKPIVQSVTYGDEEVFNASVQKLNKVPPIVTPQEIVKLKNELRDVAEGHAFLLQGGDCAELFDYCTQDMIEAKVKLLLQMSIVLIHGARMKIVRVARMAGQYAKPRSSPMEMVNGVSMPSFRGDILNSYEADPVLREPDPKRLMDAYFHSVATQNYLRAVSKSDLADMHAPMTWDLGHVRDPAVRHSYENTVRRMLDSLDMMRIIAVDGGGKFESVDLFTSHEGLLLEYEQALTRKLKNPSNYQQNIPQPETPVRRRHRQKRRKVSPLPPTESYYDTSAHMLWIGDRTRQLTHGHVEFFRGIANPIGVKVGPCMPPEDLVPLLDILNPEHEVGKIVLITRYGRDKIAAHLPGHIRAVQSSKHDGTVVWQCDPMHGNGRNATVTMPPDSMINGSMTAGPTTIKTRRFADILSELHQALQIHEAHDSYLGGMHLELTGEAVTECVGGAEELTEQDLSLNYATFCDPRLNEKQALELAFLVAGFYTPFIDEAFASNGQIE